MALDAIAMETSDKTYYAYKYTSSRRKVFDTTSSFAGAKLWKSDAGVEKVLRRLTEILHLHCSAHQGLKPLTDSPTVITIDAIDGAEFAGGERKFNRISSHKIGGQARVLPNYSEIGSYFSLCQVFKRVRWEDQDLEMLAKVIEALGIFVHE